jgi:hypothetical protein
MLVGAPFKGSKKFESLIITEAVLYRLAQDFGLCPDLVSKRLVVDLLSFVAQSITKIAHIINLHISATKTTT